MRCRQEAAVGPAVQKLARVHDDSALDIFCIDPIARRREDLEAGHFSDRQQRQASILFQQNAKRAAQLRQASPSNRELLTKVKEFGFQKL